MIAVDSLVLELEHITSSLLNAIEQDDLVLALKLVDSRQQVIDQLLVLSVPGGLNSDIKSLVDNLLTIDADIRQYLEEQKLDVETQLTRLNCANKAVKKYINVSEE